MPSLKKLKLLLSGEHQEVLSSCNRRWRNRSYLVVAFDMSDDSVEVLYSQVDIVVDLFVHSLIHGAWVSVDQKQQEYILKSSHKHN